jgi:hypothetical protein
MRYKLFKQPICKFRTFIISLKYAFLLVAGKLRMHAEHKQLQLLRP